MGVSEVVVNVSNLVVDFDRQVVVLNRLLWLTHIVASISQTNQSLKVTVVELEGLLKVMAGRLCMARLKQQVSQRDHSWWVLTIELEALLEEVSCVFKVLSFEIDQADLAIGSVVIWIVLDHKSIVL